MDSDLGQAQRPVGPPRVLGSPLRWGQVPLRPFRERLCPSLSPQATTPLTCDKHLVEGPVGLAWGLPRHVVTQADGRQRDEAEVEGVQEAPGLLKVGKDCGRHQEADGHHDQQQDHQVPAGRPLGVAAPVHVQPGQGCMGQQQRQALGRGGQQQHGGRHATFFLSDLFA